MSELLPCPCGKTPSVVQMNVEPQGDSWYGKRVEIFVLCDCGMCLFDRGFHEGFSSQDEAAAAWNRLASNLSSARTAGDDSQNTAAQVTQSVDVASESVAGRAPVAQSLHFQIMNLPCTVPPGGWSDQRIAYAVGHRDARHAAAELAATAPIADEARLTTAIELLNRVLDGPTPFEAIAEFVAAQDAKVKP